MADNNAVMNSTGLTDDEAKEVHTMFMRGAMLWGGVSLIAHFLTYSWLPWFPG